MKKQHNMSDELMNKTKRETQPEQPTAVHRRWLQTASGALVFPAHEGSATRNAAFIIKTTQYEQRTNEQNKTRNGTGTSSRKMASFHYRRLSFSHCQIPRWREVPPRANIRPVGRVPTRQQYKRE